MKTAKNKHLSFHDRCVIQQFITYGNSFTEIANRIGKDRTTISKEVRAHRFPQDKAKGRGECERLNKPPYVCNGCSARPKCSLRRYIYDATAAQNEYHKTLVLQRSMLKITKDQVAEINEIVAPLMIHRHHSVNHVYASHPEALPFSKTTFYRYIDLGILDVKNIDLQRKVRYRVKKEYDYPSNEKITPERKLGRMYEDFQEYLELHPNASVVEMDTVIGTMGGKGGNCMLTLIFRQFRFMLIYLLPYKRSEYVTKAFLDIREAIGDEEFARIFEVILTDNGTEFSDPESIEFSTKTGEQLSSVFFCAPNASWQKGTLERNHQYIRYVLPKGTSFTGLKQEDCTLLASHINSTPRRSLNNHSPYEAAFCFIGSDTIDKLGIRKIPLDDIDLSIRLLKK